MARVYGWTTFNLERGAQLVSCDVPDGAVVAGSPARIVRMQAWPA
jgi:acetyltransferase-like isoleucine patch superfamily enzyme